jgi:hypothetical protein
MSDSDLTPEQLGLQEDFWEILQYVVDDAVDADPSGHTLSALRVAVRELAAAKDGAAIQALAIRVAAKALRIAHDKKLKRK